jgi:hypothetical protein
MVERMPVPPPPAAPPPALPAPTVEAVSKAEVPPPAPPAAVAKSPPGVPAITPPPTPDVVPEPAPAASKAPANASGMVPAVNVAPWGKAAAVSAAVCPAIPASPKISVPVPVRSMADPLSAARPAPPNRLLSPAPSPRRPKPPVATAPSASGAAISRSLAQEGCFEKSALASSRGLDRSCPRFEVLPSKKSVRKLMTRPPSHYSNRGLPSD